MQFKSPAGTLPIVSSSVVHENAKARQHPHCHGPRSSVHYDYLL